MNSDMRDLFEKIQDYKGEGLFQETLIPWVEKNSFSTFIKNVAHLTSKVEQLKDLPIDVSMHYREYWISSYCDCNIPKIAILIILILKLQLKNMLVLLRQ